MFVDGLNREFSDDSPESEPAPDPQEQPSDEPESSIDGLSSIGMQVRRREAS